MEATKVSAHEVKARMDRGDPLVFIDARNAKAWGESKVKIPGAVRGPVQRGRAQADSSPCQSEGSPKGS
jgi:hypothetical protein